MIKLKLNEVICESLNSIIANIIMPKCDKNVTVIEFIPSMNTLNYLVEFPNYDLVNEVTTQTVEIFVDMYCGIDEHGNHKTLERSIEIFLCENSIPLKYLTNIGLSENNVKDIIQVISNYTQKRWTITEGKKVIRTITPKHKEFV